MAEFDIYQFEDRVADLLIGHRKLRVANETVTRDFEALARRNAELKQRLTAVIERIRALEEAQNA
jgi:FtsZ-binding cell division protein ZapB